jgi:glycosyltransferase involved in cell wall biosynthesis
MSSSTPLRILRIIDRLNVGGPAKHVVWLTAGLDRREFETLLVAGRVADGEGDMGYFAEAAGVEAETIDEMSRELSVRDVAVVFKLLRLMRRFRPDIVHTHKSKAGAVGRVAAFLYRWLAPSTLRGAPRACKVVHTFHGHTFSGYFGPTRERIFLAVERVLARLATDRIVVVSELQRQEISGPFRVGRSEQFRVVPLGIDFDEVATEPSGLRAELGLRPDDLLVATVGRLCPIKNQRLFLEAARRIGERRDSCHVRFVVVGDGELRVELEREAGRLGLRDRVTFTGFREDVARLYSDFDVVALTSRNEGTPVTLIEALCAGRAVVSTEVGGVGDLLGERLHEENGVTEWQHGLSVPTDDAQSLARAIECLLSQPELRAAMGARGRAFVRERLSTGRLVADVAALYREIVGWPQVARFTSPSHPRAAEPVRPTSIRSAPTSLPP